MNKIIISYCFSPNRRQVIILNQCWFIVNWTLRDESSKIRSCVVTFSLNKIRLKKSSAERRPYCVGLNELIIQAHGGNSPRNLEYIDTLFKEIAFKLRSSKYPLFLPSLNQTNHKPSSKIMPNVFRRILIYQNEQPIIIILSTWPSLSKCAACVNIFEHDIIDITQKNKICPCVRRTWVVPSMHRRRATELQTCTPPYGHVASGTANARWRYHEDMAPVRLTCLRCGIFCVRFGASEAPRPQKTYVAGTVAAESLSDLNQLQETQNLRRNSATAPGTQEP